MQFVEERDIRLLVERAFAEQRKRIEALVPDAEVEHIGGTAVHGALTKGDLDLLVRVPPEQFHSALAALRQRYSINQAEDWTASLASFKEEPKGEIPVGVQLVVSGGVNDKAFVDWRDRLRSDRSLLESCNAFKREHRDDDYERYTEAKAAFIEAVIGPVLGSE